MRIDEDNISRGELLATLLVLVCASVSPLVFAIAEGGYADMGWLGIYALAPAVFVMALLFLVALLSVWRRLARGMVTAVWVGVIAAGGLEVVRVIGFRFFDAMPGSMPMLMGVLFTNRFMEGPSWVSDLVGWSDHFFNGACFAMIYILVFGRRRWWVAVPYAWVIGTIFMISPVVRAMGAGDFGQLYAPVKFPLVVYLAHTAYGALLGWLVSRSWVSETTIFRHLGRALRDAVASWRARARVGVKDFASNRDSLT